MSRVASSSDQHSWHARLGCAPPACLAFLHCATHPPIPPLHPCTPAAGLGVDEYCEGASELESGSELSEDEQSCGGTSSGSDGGSAIPDPALRRRAHGFFSAYKHASNYSDP